MVVNLERCVGCGAKVPQMVGPIHVYMTSAAGCWALWGELNARLLSDPGTSPYRQLCVDAYAVQHPGSPNPQAIQSVVIHLISLYAQLERAVPSAEVHPVMQRALRRKGQYHWLTPPSFEGFRTVGHVLTGLDRIESAAHEWADDAWRAWSACHQQIKAWYNALSIRP